MPGLIVGLGNPGAGYTGTRHNAGFWFADALAMRTGAVFAGVAKFKGDVATVTTTADVAAVTVAGDVAAVAAAGGGGATVRLLKPNTFMNLSGDAVAAVTRFYKIPTERILIAHDEADLPAGAVRLKFGGGAAGHNGIADIIRKLGGSGFWRLRIGIAGIGVGRAKGGDISDYVLQKPGDDERRQIDDAITRALTVWGFIAADDYNNAMTTLHTAAKKPAAQTDGL